jgi:hypothetical protein
MVTFQKVTGSTFICSTTCLTTLLFDSVIHNPPSPKNQNYKGENSIPRTITTHFNTAGGISFLGRANLK